MTRPIGGSQTQAARARTGSSSHGTRKAPSGPFISCPGPATDVVRNGVVARVARERIAGLKGRGRVKPVGAGYLNMNAGTIAIDGREVLLA